MDDGGVVFSLSGRIEAERVAELLRLLASEAADHRTVLDLQGIDLVDRETVKFLAQCAEDGITFENCPAYIREWIVRETDGK
jgi:anti-anti-sigma regulatory factor